MQSFLPTEIIKKKNGEKGQIEIEKIGWPQTFAD